jgi:hypothetical protein
LTLPVGGHVLGLGIAKLPDFIALYSLAREIAHSVVLIFGAHLSQVGQQLLYGVHRYASHAYDAAKGVPFDKGRNNLNSFFYC